MDLFTSTTDNATHDAAYQTLSHSDYNTTDLYTTNSTDNSARTKNWAMLGVLPIVAFVAAGNILVILAVKLDHKLRSSTNYFLTSLAVADLLVAMTVMPPSLVMIINNYVWPFPDSLCGIWVMLDVCFSTSSILHLCTISLDRYWALAQPFRHRNNAWASKNSSSSGGRIMQNRRKTKWRSGSGFINTGKMTRRVTKRIILVWGISLGISLPLPILGHQNRSYIFVDNPSGGSTCVINIPEFTIYGSLVAFFLPLVVMFVTYSLTIRTLQKQSKMVRLIMGNDGSSSHTIRPSRSSSLTSGQSFKRTRSSVISIKNGYTKRPSNGAYEAMPSLPDIICTETKPLTDCNANTNQNGVTESREHKFNRPFPRSISDTHPQRFESNREVIGMNNVTARTILHKSESEASDTSNASNQQSAFGRSPMLSRANIKLSKVVSKLPLSRVSTRRISASARSRVIATEQRASKVVVRIPRSFGYYFDGQFIADSYSIHLDFLWWTNCVLLKPGQKGTGSQNWYFVILLGSVLFAITLQGLGGLFQVLGMIFTLFCLFWCPFFITNAFSGMCICYNLKCNLDLMYDLMNWFVWIGYVSSGVNPCVYTLFSRQFRETFKQIICLRCSEIPHQHRRHQFRTHNFDCGTAGSSTSSFHRDYSYKRYETSKDIGSLENGNRFGRSQSDYDFESCHMNARGHASGADEVADPENISKRENNAQEKHSMDSQWRSTWHGTNRGDTLKELKLTESIRIHNVSRVTFREAFLQPYSKRKPLLQESDGLTSLVMKGEALPNNSSTF